MNIQFFPADTKKEAKELNRIDKRAGFVPADWWSPKDWEDYMVYRFTVDGKIVGHVAFGDTMVFTLSEEDEDWTKDGSVYLAATTILPEYRTPEISEAVWAWKIAWAEEHGFKMISTNCRVSDTWYRELCEKFGFTVIGQEPYFEAPDEDTVIFELKLS
jgi:hypothetical protein